MTELLAEVPANGMNRETITPAVTAEQAAVRGDKLSHDPVPQDQVSPELVLVQAFQSFEAELLGMLYHILGNIEDARDACQEAFVRC